MARSTLRTLTFALLLSAVSLTIGCTSSNSLTASKRDPQESEPANCIEPENPYTQGTGHYAGYEWEEEKGIGVCGGSSESFREGCEKYEQQQAEYEDCEARKAGCCGRASLLRLPQQY